MSEREQAWVLNLCTLKTSTLQSNQEKCMLLVSIWMDLSLPNLSLDWTLLQLRKEVAGSSFPKWDTKAVQKYSRGRGHVSIQRDTLLVVDGDDQAENCCQSNSWNHLQNYLKYQMHIFQCIFFAEHYTHLSEIIHYSAIWKRGTWVIKDKKKTKTTTLRLDSVSVSPSPFLELVPYRALPHH